MTRGEPEATGALTMLGETTFQGSRLSPLATLGLPLVICGLAGSQSFAAHGVFAISGWIALLAGAACAVLMVVRMLRPPRLTLSDKGFVWTSSLSKRCARVRWADVEEVGFYSRPRLSLRTDQPNRRIGVGYRLKASTMPDAPGRRTAGVRDRTDWDGVLINSWEPSAGYALDPFSGSEPGWPRVFGAPTSTLVFTFRRYLEAARAAAA